MTGPTAATRRLVIARDRGVCAWCGLSLSGQAMSLQHRLPRGMGGTRVGWVNGPANLVAVHGTGTTGCHGLIERDRERALRLGFLIRHGMYAAADVPIRMPSVFTMAFGWALLTDAGDRLELDDGDAFERLRRLGIPTARHAA